MEDFRFKRANFEALCSVLLALLYLGWWYFFAYGPSSFDPMGSGLIMGLPKWFFMSSVLGPFLFCFLAWAMVALLFKEVPIASKGKDHEQN